MILSTHPGRYKILGQTIDDAIGEAIDKIGRHICSEWASSGGLGKSLENLAEKGDALPYQISCLDHTVNPLSFSFSGLKTSLLEFIKMNENSNIEDLAATVQKVLFDHLLDRVELCIKILNLADFKLKQMSVIGGVASNQCFKYMLTERLRGHDIEVLVPPPEICTDNAVMIGLAALHSFSRAKYRTNINSFLNRPDQNWNIEELSICKSVLE